VIKGSGLRMDQHSIKKFHEELDDLSDRTSKAAASGLKAFAYEVIEQSKREVPVDTGALRASAFVEDPQINDKEEKVTIELGYGRQATQINPESGLATTSYMVDQHENLLYFHKVGKAKYLEDPVRSLTPKFGITLERFISQELTGVGGSTGGGRSE
jgi:hypothetical protein